MRIAGQHRVDRRIIESRGRPDAMGDEIIVPGVDMGTNNVHMNESLVDEFPHQLSYMVNRDFQEKHNLNRSTHLPALRFSPGDHEDPSNAVPKLDG